MVELPGDNLAMLLPLGKVSDTELGRHITARALMASVRCICPCDLFCMLL